VDEGRTSFHVRGAMSSLDSNLVDSSTQRVLMGIGCDIVVTAVGIWVGGARLCGRSPKAAGGGERQARAVWS
jgi:hypothetical protein